MESDAGDFSNRRNETDEERYDRNWVEILQVLRVTQTGTQIMSGFLLTIAFQPRFNRLDAYQVSVYVVLGARRGKCEPRTDTGSFASHTVPSAREEEDRPDRQSALKTTLAVVSVLTAGVVLFILDVVIGRAAGSSPARRHSYFSASCWR